MDLTHRYLIIKFVYDCRKHNQQIEIDIAEASIAVRKEEELVKQLEQQSIDRFAEIEEIEKQNLDMATEMAKLMQKKSGTEATFVHQLDLADFYDRIESFGQFVDQFMRTNFKTEVKIGFFIVRRMHNSYRLLQENSNSNVEEETKKEIDKLEMTKNTLWFTLKQHMEAEIKVNSQRFIITRLKQEIKPMSMATIKMQLAELRERNRELEIKKELKLTELEFALRKEVELNVDLTIQEYTQGKVDQARDRVKRFQDANLVVTEQLIVADILWIMSNADIDRFERFAKISVVEQYEVKALACNKRTEIMRQTSFDEANDTFWHQLYVAVGSPYGDCIEHFVKIYRQIQAMCKQLKFQSYADDIDAVRENM